MNTKHQYLFSLYTDIDKVTRTVSVSELALSDPWLLGLMPLCGSFPQEIGRACAPFIPQSPNRTLWKWQWMASEARTPDTVASSLLSCFLYCSFWRKPAAMRWGCSSSHMTSNGNSQWQVDSPSRCISTSDSHAFRQWLMRNLELELLS